MNRGIKLLSAFFFILLARLPAHADSLAIYVPPIDSYGHPANMESGDIVYRRLAAVDFLPNNPLGALVVDSLQAYHAGVYLGFAYPESAVTGDTHKGLSYALPNHTVAEANTEEAGTHISPGLFRINYQQFRDAGAWVGAKRWPDITAAQRKAVVAGTTDMGWGEAQTQFVGIPNILTTAIVRKDRNLPATPDNINAIRCDTYVDMVYALAGLPIRGDIINFSDTYNTHMIATTTIHVGIIEYKIKIPLFLTKWNPYTQSHEPTLGDAAGTAPTIEIQDSAGHKLADNAEVSATDFKIYVNDGEYGSGIRLLEIWKGNPANADSTLVKSVWTNLMQGTTFYDTNHTYLPMEWYSASSPSGYLNYGRYYARAFDNAGNFSLGCAVCNAMQLKEETIYA